MSIKGHNAIWPTTPQVVEGEISPKVILRYGGEPFVVDTKGYALDFGLTGGATKIQRFDMGASLALAAVEFQGSLWIFTDDGKLYSWDGTILTTDSTGLPAGGSVAALADDGTNIYLGTFGALRRRTAPGTWSTLTLPVSGPGTYEEVGNGFRASLGGDFAWFWYTFKDSTLGYIRLVKVTGASPTLAFTGPVFFNYEVPGGSAFQGRAFNGKLYHVASLYVAAPESFNVKLYEYDGATNAAVFDFTTGLGAVSTDVGPLIKPGLEAFDGSLYLLGKHSATRRLWKSNGGSVTSWSLVSSLSGTLDAAAASMGAT